MDGDHGAGGWWRRSTGTGRRCAPPFRRWAGATGAASCRICQGGICSTGTDRALPRQHQQDKRVERQADAHQEIGAGPAVQFTDEVGAQECQRDRAVHTDSQAMGPSWIKRVIPMTLSRVMEHRKNPPAPGRCAPAPSVPPVVYKAQLSFWPRLACSTAPLIWVVVGPANQLGDFGGVYQAVKLFMPAIARSTPDRRPRWVRSISVSVKPGQIRGRVQAAAHQVLAGGAHHAELGVFAHDVAE